MYVSDTVKSLILGLPETPSEAKWLSTKLAESDLVGVDPYLITANKFKILSNDMERFGQILVPVAKNLVDTVWNDKPKKPAAIVKSHPVSRFVYIFFLKREKFSLPTGGSMGHSKCGSS